MNVGELLRERDRLLSVIEEAKTARTKLRQINVLIAMYGDDEKVSTNGTVPVGASPHTPGECVYPDCDTGKPVYIRGLCVTHYNRWQKQTRDWEAIDPYILPSKTGAH